MGLYATARTASMFIRAGTRQRSRIGGSRYRSNQPVVGHSRSSSPECLLPSTRGSACPRATSLSDKPLIATGGIAMLGDVSELVRSQVTTRRSLPVGGPTYGDRRTVGAFHTIGLCITVRLPSGGQIHQVGRPGRFGWKMSVQQVNVTPNHTPVPRIARAGQAPYDDETGTVLVTSKRSM